MAACGRYKNFHRYFKKSSTGIIPKTPGEIVQFLALAPVMTEVILYTCPTCEANCSVAPDLVRLNVVCPSCGQEFTANPPDPISEIQVPEAMPFFKTGKRKILKNLIKQTPQTGWV